MNARRDSLPPPSEVQPRSHLRLRAAGGISVLSIAMLAASAGMAGAASVTPTPISSGNPTCSDFNSSWTELKVENPANGTYTDGTLTVTITNFEQSVSGTPGSFDWSSNIGVDAVLVKAGTDKHNLYVYDPEATSDTNLSPQAGQGNGISHISFCYDAEAPGSESVPPPSASVPPTGGVLPLTPPPSDLGAGGGGDLTPPPTDETVTEGQTQAAWPVVLLLIAMIIAGASFLTPARRIR